MQTCADPSTESNHSSDPSYVRTSEPASRDADNDSQLPESGSSGSSSQQQWSESLRSSCTKEQSNAPRREPRCSVDDWNPLLPSPAGKTSPTHRTSTAPSHHQPQFRAMSAAAPSDSHQLDTSIDATARTVAPLPSDIPRPVLPPARRSTSSLPTDATTTTPAADAVATSPGPCQSSSSPSPAERHHQSAASRRPRATQPRTRSTSQKPISTRRSTSARPTVASSRDHRRHRPSVGAPMARTHTHTAPQPSRTTSKGPDNSLMHQNSRQPSATTAKAARVRLSEATTHDVQFRQRDTRIDTAAGDHGYYVQEASSPHDYGERGMPVDASHSTHTSIRSELAELREQMQQLTIAIDRQQQQQQQQQRQIVPLAAGGSTGSFTAKGVVNNTTHKSHTSTPDRQSSRRPGSRSRSARRAASVSGDTPTSDTDTVGRVQARAVERRQQLTAAQTALKQARSWGHALKTERDALVDQQRTDQQHIQTLKAAVSRLRTHVAGSTRKLKAAEAERDSMAEQLRKATAELKAERSRHADTKGRLAELQSELQETQCAMDHEAESRSEAEAKLHTARQQLRMMKQSLQQTQLELRLQTKRALLRCKEATAAVGCSTTTDATDATDTTDATDGPNESSTSEPHGLEGGKRSRGDRARFGKHRDVNEIAELRKSSEAPATAPDAASLMDAIYQLAMKVSTVAGATSHAIPGSTTPRAARPTVSSARRSAQSQIARSRGASASQKTAKQSRTMHSKHPRRARSVCSSTASVGAAPTHRRRRSSSSKRLSQSSQVNTRRSTSVEQHSHRPHRQREAAASHHVRPLHKSAQSAARASSRDITTSRTQRQHGTGGLSPQLSPEAPTRRPDDAVDDVLSDATPAWGTPAPDHPRPTEAVMP